MTTIKHTLQRQVFLPAEERLLAVVHVTKAGRKKKTSFLCAAMTMEKPIQALIVQVTQKKAGDRDVYKKKHSWALRQLKVFDAKYQNKDSAEFDMILEKPYKWVASSIAEKTAFIHCLYKLSQRYVVQKPDFINTPPHMLEEGAVGGEDAGRTQDLPLSQEASEDYHALSYREEQDLQTIMTQSSSAISDAEDFTDQLSKDLSVLDGANIHSIMASEEQVLELMVLLDTGLQQAISIEQKLDEYEHKLQSVKELMEVMKDKDLLIHVRNKNNTQLLSTLDQLVGQLDLEHHHMTALVNSELTSATGVADCSAAAQALQKCMAAHIPPELANMAAIQEQQKFFVKLKSAFCKRVTTHLNNLFIHQGNELMGGTSVRQSVELKLPQHMPSHRELLPYAELMHWIQVVDPAGYHKLRKEYVRSLHKLYEREVKEFMEASKNRLAQRLGKVPGGMSPQRSAGASGSSSSLNKDSCRSVRSGSLSTLDSDSLKGSDPDVSGRMKFDQMLEHVLSELDPWCLAEQHFCTKFFNLVSSEPPDLTPPLDTTDGGTPQKAKTPKKSDDVITDRRMMGELFSSLEAELTSFISFGISMDNFNSLYMLVRVGNHVINAQDTSSFLSKTFGNCLVQIKRSFDKFVQTQMTSVQDYKLSKKTKVGILPFVHNFETFAKQAEAVFKPAVRRTDLDKAYARLVATVFQEITRVSGESLKTPRDVIIFENYHHMYSALSSLKISSLESQRKEAKQRYNDHLHAYVVSCMGRPLDKLHSFFEGIEMKVGAGVKEEEVGYQLAYSKQELRKVIHEYPGKEVKRGLDQLIKKIEKQLCEEENLLQVVWHTVQDEFLRQYKHYEDMIRRCYPGSEIQLEFTIENLLTYFSDIAQSH